MYVTSNGTCVTLLTNCSDVGHGSITGQFTFEYLRLFSCLFVHFWSIFKQYLKYRTTENSNRNRMLDQNLDDCLGLSKNLTIQNWKKKFGF